MFVDDRLATVLRQRATSEASARTQFRQLLDILGNRKFAAQDERSASLIAAAWLRMDALAELIPPADRAAMVREPGWRFRSPDLASHLAEHEPEVASAALNRAQLSAEDWGALIPRLPIRARGFLRLRKDLPVDAEKLLERLGVHDRGLPSPTAVPTTVSTASPEPPDLATPAGEPDAGASPAPSDEQEDVSGQVATQISGPDADISPPPAIGFDPDDRGRSEISALVERIAQFRRTRDQSPVDSEQSPKLPLGLPGEGEGGSARRSLRAFGFSTDASGRIDWAQGEADTMMIGKRIVTPAILGRPDSESALERAFRRRQPITSASLRLFGAPAIDGEWIVDAHPSFTEDGSFSGYLGRFRRPAGGGDDALSPAAREADRIRQLLHELRTPVTAVQGYAEVIQQQLFGPAPHEYRALAAAIAADAARILAGFEELDRLAKLETGAVTLEPGEADLSSIAQTITDQLAQVLASREAAIELAQEGDAGMRVAIDNEDAEALLWRLLATLGSAIGTGETLEVRLTQRADEAILKCDLPRQLADEADIFSAEVKPASSPINAGLFGAGFALRLARAEARAAGGDLSHAHKAVTLALPLLTPTEGLPSQNEDAAGGPARA